MPGIPGWKGSKESFDAYAKDFKRGDPPVEPLEPRTDVSPEGWEGTVTAMKDHPEIDNPWALAWYMKGEGYQSHKDDCRTDSDFVQRYDLYSLPKGVQRTAQGGARVPANLTRTGVFVYLNPDGSERRELRLPEEVFKADSLTTLNDAPVVEGHPDMINTENWSTHSAGHLSGEPHKDGKFVAGNLVVQRASTVGKLGRELQEVSLGYQCRLETKSGTYQGERYDAIQRDIRYNHVGLGPRGWGRAGPDVGLRLDGRSAILDLTADRHHGEIMKIRFDGKDYEANSDELFAAMQAKLDSTQAQADKDAARADGLDSQVKDLTTKLTEANDPKRLDAAIASRVALVVNATKVLGDTVKLDGKTDREIMVETVQVAFKDVKLDGKSDDYVSALFDQAIASGKRADGIGGFTNALARVRADASDPAEDEDEKAEKEFEKRRQDRAKQPMAMSKDSKGSK